MTIKKNLFYKCLYVFSVWLGVHIGYRDYISNYNIFYVPLFFMLGYAPQLYRHTKERYDVEDGAFLGSAVIAGIVSWHYLYNLIISLIAFSVGKGVSIFLSE